MTVQPSSIALAFAAASTISAPTRATQGVLQTRSITVRALQTSILGWEIAIYLPCITANGNKIIGLGSVATVHLATSQ